MNESRLLRRIRAPYTGTILLLFSLFAPQVPAQQGGNETSLPPVNLDPVTALFAQVAVGGGYTTTFALLNTGATDLSGRLILTDSQGNPMDVALRLPSAGLPQARMSDRVLGDSMNILIPRGGIRFVAAEPLSPQDGTRTGWARVESSGGSLGGAATFQLVEGGDLKTIAGVLAAAAVEVATIPINNDDAQNRFTGYAVANPSAGAVNIKIVILDEGGTAVETLFPPALNPLGPGKQVARFLHQDSQRLKFKGSMVLLAETGKPISVVALVLDQGLLTAIPVIAAKAPHVN